MAALDEGLVHGVLQRRGLRQFVKFCIVGASSTLWDFGIFYVLIELVHLQQYFVSQDVGRSIAVCLSFLVAVTNGFYWNNRWTFRQEQEWGGWRRYTRFVITNVIGLALNLTITLTIARLAPPAVVALLRPYLRRDPAVFFGKAVATVIVVFWNFTASKYWTFKK